MKDIMTKLSASEVMKRMVSGDFSVEMLHRNCKNNDRGVAKEKAHGIYETIFNRDIESEKMSETRKESMLQVIEEVASAEDTGLVRYGSNMVVREDEKLDVVIDIVVYHVSGDDSNERLMNVSYAICNSKIINPSLEQKDYCKEKMR